MFITIRFDVAWIRDTHASRTIPGRGGDIINAEIKADSSTRLWVLLVTLAVIASGTVLLFVLCTEADGSSADVSDSGVCGPNANYTYYSDGTLEISGYGDMYDYQFASTPWFPHTESITKIVIGDDITSLSKWAFVKCTALKELTLPITINTVKYDVYPAFQGCCNIEKIMFTVGKDGYGHDYAAYKGNNSWYQNTPWYLSRGVLKEITFADGITHIGSDAFRELNITSIVIPDSVTSLGNHSFFNCTRLTDLTISMSVNPVHNKDYPSFKGCTAIENVTLTRGNGNPYTYEKSWTGYVEDADRTPWNLYSNVPKKIIISNDVTSLTNYLFYNCNIRELTIPISLNSVWTNTYPIFKDIIGIEKVTLTPGSGFGFDYASNFSGDCYYQYTPWYQSKGALKEIVLEDGIKHIGSDAFRELNITSLVIPDSVESLGTHTFYKCDKLTTLSMPISLDSVVSTSYPAFDQCSNISSLRLTAGTTGIGFEYTDYLPIWCSSDVWLSKLSVHSRVASIGDKTFNGYSFYVDSNLVTSTPENLSGQTFSGAAGTLNRINRILDDPGSTGPSNTVNDDSTDSMKLILVIGFGLITALVVILARSYIRYSHGNQSRRAPSY